MLNKVKDMALDVLSEDKSGHGSDHVLRVYNLALKFADIEKGDKDIVSLAALLHDVDDYKLVGKENADELYNARNIMQKVGISSNTQESVLNIIQNMGFSKFLKGIRPKTLEGMIVSDADMCDAIGANGIIRSFLYAVSDKGNGVIFNNNVFPTTEITSDTYNSKGTTHDTDSAINHFFEKLLRLKDIMLTGIGFQEAAKRHQIMIDFLWHFLEEENAQPKWFELLSHYD